MPSLTMPLYVNHDDVILRMQVNGDLPGVTDVVDSAIIGAQLQVQSLTQSTLEIVNHHVTYFLDSDAFSGMQPGGVFRLEIPSGFLRDDFPVTLTYDTTWKLLNPQTPDPTTYRIDYRRGYILMDAQIYHDQYVKLLCTTGFAVPTVPAVDLTVNVPTQYSDVIAYNVNNVVYYLGNLFVAADSSTGVTPGTTADWVQLVPTPEQVPVEVYEAIMSFVSVVFDASQTTNRDQQQEPQAKKAFDRAQLLLQPYLRMKGFSFRPVWN